MTNYRNNTLFARYSALMAPGAFIAVFFASLVALSSCSNNGCTENRNAVPLAQFCSASTGKEIALDSIEVYGYGQPTDSILHSVGTPISQIYLPMRPTHESVKWCFAYKWKALDFPELVDTVTINYRSTPYFASEECGVYFRYEITELTCTDHIIDKVEIADSTVTNIDKVYLKILFRTNNEE